MARRWRSKLICAILFVCGSLPSSQAAPPADQRQNLVRIRLERAGDTLAEGTGAWISADGVLATSFELLRTALESRDVAVRFQSSSGSALPSFQVLDCGASHLPCLLRFKVKTPQFFRPSPENTSGRKIIGYQDGIRFAELDVAGKNIESKEMLAFDEGAVLLDSAGNWLRILSSIPSPEGRLKPAWLGYDAPTLKRKLRLPSVDLAQARKLYAEARTAASNALQAQYVTPAYAAYVGRKSWPSSYRSVKIGGPYPFTTMIPQWLSECAPSGAFALECKDAVGSATLRVSVRDVKTGYLQSLGGKPLPGSGATEPMSCQQLTDAWEDSILMNGYDCRYALTGDGAPNGKSIHHLLQRKDKLIEVALWFRDPMLSDFMVHVPELFRRSALPSGRP